MIRLANVFAKGASGRGKPPSHLKNVTLARTGGVLSVIGAPGDGTSLLLAVIAGRVAAKGGRAEIAGAVAHVPLDAMLPEILRVDEACDLAATLRGEPARPATERLASLGLEALARRPVRSLSPAEIRAVSLAIALTSRAENLLVEEPLADLEPVAPSRVVEAIRARAAAGATVIVTTASVRDATRLGDELAMITQGMLAPLAPGLAHVGAEGARLRVVVAASRLAALVGAITEDPAVLGVETSTYAAPGAAAVLVAGRDLVAIAAAVASASARTGIDVEAIESAVLPVDAIRATLMAPRQAALPSVPPGPAAASASAPASASASAPASAPAPAPAPASEDGGAS